MKNQKLTSIQWNALKGSGFNLSVAHAKFAYTAEQQKIIDRTPQIFGTIQQQTQVEVEKQFIHAFFHLAGQSFYKNLQHPIFHYSTSAAIEVFGNMFRLLDLSVGLITPTFDNLADILRRHSAKPLIPIEEHTFKNPHLYLDPSTFNTLFLTMPNNPTGFYLTKEEFVDLCLWCKKHGKLLTLDFCFRFFSPYHTWDQYQVLYETEVDFIAYEDTGKMWSTAELKTGFIVCSQKYYSLVKSISDDFLLNVSPFILLLLKEFILIEKKDDLSIHTKVKKNRKYLESKIQDTPLKLQGNNELCSVAWIKHNYSISATEIVKKLEKRKVFINPGRQFYWNNYEKGEEFIRLALARDPDYFKQGVDIMIEEMNSWKA